MNVLKEPTEENEDRYIRRVQLTGRGSFIVSIPKRWVEETGLDGLGLHARVKDLAAGELPDVVD